MAETWSHHDPAPTMLCEHTKRNDHPLSYLVITYVLLAFTSLTITGDPMLHKALLNYSWAFSRVFVHVLMNNNCQLPAGVHPFFFLSRFGPLHWYQLLRLVAYSCVWTASSMTPIAGWLPWWFCIAVDLATTGSQGTPAVLYPLSPLVEGLPCSLLLI